MFKSCHLSAFILPAIGISTSEAFTLSAPGKSIWIHSWQNPEIGCVENGPGSNNLVLELTGKIIEKGTANQNSSSRQVLGILMEEK